MIGETLRLLYKLDNEGLLVRERKPLINDRVFTSVFYTKENVFSLFRILISIVLLFVLDVHMH